MGVGAAVGNFSRSWAASADAKVGKGVGSSKSTPRGRPPGPPLPLRGASSNIYNGGVCKWGLLYQLSKQYAYWIALISFHCWAISGISWLL
jgi:hypothetical protein